MLAGSDEGRDSAVVSSAGEPGPLSRLLQELADASIEDGVDAWKRELEPGTRVGRFEIRREVGRGGFGAVYEAFDTELNRVVAVKTLRLSRPRHDLSSDWIKKEAEAVARLDHPCIVTLFDVGTCDSGPYLVMELLRGKTLAQRIAERPIPRAEALRIAEEMAKGLAHAHQRGVLHRDLKPANVFLCEDGRVKLLDFGLAHLLGTEGVSRAGTPRYMAPEQARGDTVDQRADVFAAGRVLGEMAVGKRPRRLEQAISQATSADPRGRPRDGQAWLELLQSARRGVEQSARMPRAALLAGIGVILGIVAASQAFRRPPPGADPGRSHAQPSIAVMPFKDLSPNHDQEYFSDGIAEEILNSLSKVKGLRVPGRASTFHFKGRDASLEEVGRELRVDHVLEGSVRRSGDRVRISAEVLTVASGARVWSETFERIASDVFAIQDEIANAVVGALRVRLLGAESTPPPAFRTAIPEAYQSYLLGRHFSQSLSPDAQVRAVAALERSVDLDPGFAPGWAALAGARLAVGYVDAVPWETARSGALQAAERAVALAPDLPEALAARAYARLWEWEWRGAKQDIDRALALGPDVPWANDAMGDYFWWTGLPAESVTWYERRVAVDPLSGTGWNNLAVAYLITGRFGDARSALDRVLEVDPRNAYARNNVGLLLIWEGKPAEGLVHCERLEPVSLVCVALAEHGLGNDARAHEVLAVMTKEPSGNNLVSIAAVEACLGHATEALAWLERAREERVRKLNELQVNPCFRPLHSDPRWKGLLRKMNLPPD